MIVAPRVGAMEFQDDVKLRCGSGARPSSHPRYSFARVRVPVPAPLLVLGSVLSVQFGQAFGKQLFGVVGPIGVATLRLGFAAVVLMLFWRPVFPSSWRSLRLSVAFGTAIAGMNVIYPALRFLPLGVATTLQLLGPLAVALVGSRRVLDLCWALLALGGVVLFTHSPTGAQLPVMGVCLALVAAVSMGSYVLLSHRAGGRSADGSTLALAVVWAALIALPFGVVESGAALLTPVALLAGVGLAILSAVVPYSLDLSALRRLPPRIVGVLQSLEPAVGALAGFLVLTEHLTSTQVVGIGCVTVASLGAVLAGNRRRPGSR